MMLDHTTTIDGITYTTRSLPATQGLIILPKLLAIFPETLLKLLFETSAEDRDTLFDDPSVVASVMHAIARNASQSNGLLVVKDLLKGTSSDTVRIGTATAPGEIANHFDGHFAGRYGHLAAVAMWVASVNFIGPSGESPFLGGSGTTGPEQATAKASGSRHGAAARLRGRS